MNTSCLFAEGCPIGHVSTGYVPLLDLGGRTLIVGDAPRWDDVQAGRPHSDGVGAWAYSMISQARLDRKTLSQVNVIGCFAGIPRQGSKEAQAIFPGSKKWTLTPRGDARAAVEYCRQHHLAPALEKAAKGGQYQKVIALGENALQATTGKPGISFWRGSPLPLRGHESDGPKVIPTLDPLTVMKQANYFSVCVGDLKKGLVLPPENYNLRPSLEDVKAFTATKYAFDLEWNEMGEVTICGLTSAYYKALVVPWQEPYLTELKRIFEAAEELIGHNIIGADMKYIKAMGWNITAKLSDTILKQHLVQPDIRHALSVVASIFTSKVFWKGKWEFENVTEDESQEEEVRTGVQWKTWDDPVNGTPRQFGGYVGCDSAFEAFRLYNARDTDAEFQVNFPLDQMLKQFNLERIYKNVSLPAGILCDEAGNTGIRLDHSRIKIIQEVLTAEVAELEVTLPEELRSHPVQVTRMKPAPPNTYRPGTRKCKGKKSLGTQHERVEIAFIEPGVLPCPSCGVEVKSPKLTLMKTVKVLEWETVVPWNSAPQVQAYASNLNCKTVMNRKTGSTTAGKNARKVWGRDHSEFTVIDQLKRKITVLNSFTKGDPVAKTGLYAIERVLFNLLVFGTATGRLSCSGREPANLNLQNQPKSVRHMFVPDKPGYVFVAADFSGGENNLTAFLANDVDRLERLRDPTFDEHSALASRFFEMEVSKTVNKHLRQPGKIFSHGKTYGMGIRTMWENFMLEGYNYPEAKIREFDRQWKELNRGTADWQERTMNQAGKQGYLKNAFGRMRWFQSRDFGTKALAFLPSSTLADIALRVMVGIHASRFQQECIELGLTVTGDLPPGWRFVLQIHDEICLCGPPEGAEAAAHLLKSVMEQPWKELEGFALRVEVSMSDVSWGDMTTVQF